MEENVLQISSKNYVFGCGFFVGHFFITAAHVIENAENPFVKIGTEKVFLKKEDALYFDYDNAQVAHDIAIFKILASGVNRLALSSETIKRGGVYKSYSYREMTLGTEFILCNATIEDVDKEAFSATMSAALRSGSSGSPLCNKQNLVGMLVRGNDKDLCVFISSKEIIRILSHIK